MTSKKNFNNTNSFNNDGDNYQGFFARGPLDPLQSKRPLLNLANDSFLKKLFSQSLWGLGALKGALYWQKNESSSQKVPNQNQTVNGTRKQKGPLNIFSGTAKQEEKVSVTYEEIGLFPRSFSRVLDRFLKQVFSDVENLVIQEYRFYRYLFLTTVRCLFILFFVPFLVNFFAKNYLIHPLTEYFWNTKQTEIFLNSYQQKRAFAELKEFEEKLYFESLIHTSTQPLSKIGSLGTFNPNPTENIDLNESNKGNTVFHASGASSGQPNQKPTSGSRLNDSTAPQGYQGPQGPIRGQSPLIRAQSQRPRPLTLQGGIWGRREQSTISGQRPLSSPHAKGQSPLVAPLQRDKGSLDPCKGPLLRGQSPLIRGQSPLIEAKGLLEKVNQTAQPVRSNGPNSICSQVHDKCMRSMHLQAPKRATKIGKANFLSVGSANTWPSDKWGLYWSPTYKRALPSCKSSSIQRGKNWLASVARGPACQRPEASWKHALACQGMQVWQRPHLEEAKGLLVGANSKGAGLNTEGFLRGKWGQSNLDQEAKGLLQAGPLPHLAPIPKPLVSTNVSVLESKTKVISVPLGQKQKLQEKIVEIATRYNEQSIEAITNFFADLLSLITLFYLLFALEIQINITKSFLLEVFFGLDDSKKSLFILLITDLLVGYHSSNIWELFFSFIFNHYGLPESQTGIFLLVATLPVLLDVLFKYLIFRHLNRSSPATVATYHAMIE